MEAIRLENVYKYYRLKNELICAVDNCSYTFEYGKLYVIMGHSGSGKSTLIQCIGLLDKINNGKIFVDGKDVNDFSLSKQNNVRNKKIGFIFQDYYLNNTMKAYENVMLPMLINENYKKINKKEKAKNLLSEVGLSERVKHYPKQLSGGEQQRVAIARALANNPDIILADEPTGNLDEENEIYVLKKLKDLALQGKCVIVVSHNITTMEYADVVLKMKKGKLMVEENE